MKKLTLLSAILIIGLISCKKDCPQPEPQKPLHVIIPPDKIKETPVLVLVTGGLK